MSILLLLLSAFLLAVRELLIKERFELSRKESAQRYFVLLFGLVLINLPFWILGD